MNSPTPSKDVAVPGLLRPPLVLLAAIALGVVLNVIWPFRCSPSALGMAGPVIVFAAVLLFALSLKGISSSWDFRAGNGTHHHHCPHRSLPIQPQSYLCGFRFVPSWIGTLVKQPVAARGSGSVRQLHLYHDHPAGGTIPRTQFPCSVF